MHIESFHFISDSVGIAELQCGRSQLNNLVTLQITRHALHSNVIACFVIRVTWPEQAVLPFPAVKRTSEGKTNHQYHSLERSEKRLLNLDYSIRIFWILNKYFNVFPYASYTIAITFNSGMAFKSFRWCVFNEKMHCINFHALKLST